MLPGFRRLTQDETFSAAALAALLRGSGERGLRWFDEAAEAALIAAAAAPEAPGIERFRLSRVLHSLGSAALQSRLPGRARRARELQEEAFANISRTIVTGGLRRLCPYPESALRSDEIVWGRVPARLDLGGGWTDTPPYSLERGGRVINAAVNLNGQPPIQAYARVTSRREIRLASIDQGSHLVVRDLSELLDYRSPAARFGLAKAALALSGFSPEHARWPAGVRTLGAMLRKFGGGIELTTLAAIPSGSGLGTSSLMGSVLIAAIQRVMGREPAPDELFHKVLQLEQELTTGGGWQDQIGGVLPGVKLIVAEAGLVPSPRIRDIPSDLLDPRSNGGRTLLFYTGIRRLAKNILRQVVGRYLDRDGAAMVVLDEMTALPALVADALSRRDENRFGGLIDQAWRLNKTLDPASTTPEIEAVLSRIRRRIRGAKLLGAGGGGFLLIVGRTPDDAVSIRRDLARRPPNPRARFFEFEIDTRGLQVTVS